MELYDITIVRGDDFALGVEWEADSEPVPIDSARLHVRRTADTADALLELTEGDGLTITDNRIDIAITDTDSEDLRTGVWDVEATSTGGQVKTLVGGKFYVTKDVTHD